MGLLDLSLKDAANDFTSRIRDPFDRFFAAPLDTKGALERNDFRNGFNISEFQEGRELTKEAIQLVGKSMPHVPFSFGGEQKIIKDYYPGNSEPTVQVLGPRENNIVIKGRLYSKNLPVSINDADIEEVRRFPDEMRSLIDAMRIRGNLVRIRMGEFQRYGFIEKTSFDMRTLADIGYEIEFSIIGFNPPRGCKVSTNRNQIPFDINKELIANVNSFLDDGLTFPENFDRSLATQISEAVSDVASAINLVTDFVDGVLDQVDAVREAVARAEGLIQNAKNNITRLINRVGSLSSSGGVVFSATSGIGVSSGYVNASKIQSTITGTYSLSAFLAQLQEQLNLIALTEPQARHRVQSGDTLQRLAVKFYNDVEQWSEIFDHNKLQDVDLELIKGQVIEIPRVG